MARERERVRRAASRATIPARFGFFATLTLPDVDGALAEAAHAFDALGAAGVILLANTHGRVSRRAGSTSRSSPSSTGARAVVFVHPVDAARARACPGIPPFAADFLLDTTRAAYRLVQSGARAPLPEPEDHPRRTPAASCRTRATA